MINPDLIPAEFWQSEWSIKPQDSASVRNQIKEALDQMIKNYELNKNWNNGVKLSLSDGFDLEDDDSLF